MGKVKFCSIKSPHIAIHFSTQAQLERLVDYLNAYGYCYGTGGSDLNEIKELGVRFFSHDEFNDSRYLSLDRSKSHYHSNYVSCGLGYEDDKYDFKEIDWNVE